MTPKQLEMFPMEQPRTPRSPEPPALTPASTLDAAMAPFGVYMQQKEFMPNTIDAFGRDLQMYLDHVGANTVLGDCTTPQLRAFINHMRTARERPCSPKTLDRRITTLKVFFGWLAEKGILDQDPAAALAGSGAKSPIPQILTEQQIEQVLTLTESMWHAEKRPDARPHLLVTLLLETAVKKSECLKIELAQIDLSDAEHPSVYIGYDTPRKRFKARRLAISPTWVRTLESYLVRYQPKAMLFECTGRNLEYVLHTTSTVAGLSFAMTFEMLRWTCAVRAYRNGLDTEHLRRKLGLSRISWAETLPIITHLAAGPL